ncbi:MAG: hypothetical protein K6B43_02615 [Treponema sp.]|nr:hypothetical protein [Treponema sp.]
MPNNNSDLVEKIVKETKSNKRFRYLVLSCIFMLIPVFLSFFTYHRESFLGLWTDNVNIHPNLVSTTFSVLLYSALILRGIVQINFKSKKHLVLIFETLLTCLNILFIASFTSIFVNTSPIFKLINVGLFKAINPTSMLIAGVLLSWLGMKSIAGYVWIIMFFVSITQITKVSEAMGFVGAIYILSAFLSIAFQFIPNNKFAELAQAIKSDFKIAKKVVYADVQSAKVATKKIAKNVAGMPYIENSNSVAEIEYADMKENQESHDYPYQQ